MADSQKDSFSFEVGGDVVAKGEEYLETTHGTQSNFTIQIASGGRRTTVTNPVITDSMYAVTLDSQSITGTELQDIYDEVAALKDSVTEENVYSEVYLGKLLNLAGKLYLAIIVVTIIAMQCIVDDYELMLEYLDGNTEAGTKLESKGWITAVLTVLTFGTSRMANQFIKSSLTKNLGKKVTEKLLKDYSAKELKLILKNLSDAGISNSITKEYAEKFGKDGIEWLLSKQEKGLTADYLKLFLEVDDIGLISDDLIAAIRNSDGLGGDIIKYLNKYGADIVTAFEKYGDEAVKVIKDYGDEAVKIIQDYGDEAVKVIKDYGDEAVEGFRNGKTPEEITSPTKPSLERGGKPRGNYATGSSDGIINQNEAANILAENGYDVFMLDEVSGGNGYGIADGTNPDYLIEGRVFDCYSPEPETDVESIIRSITRKTTRQSERIVLNLEHYPVENIELLKQRINDKINGDLKHLKELIIIKDNKVETWFVR